MKSRLKLLLALAVLLVLVAPDTVHACAACFGKSDSPMAKGMNAGILTLLAIIGAVLTGAASFFVFLARRAAMVQKEEQNAIQAPNR